MSVKELCQEIEARRTEQLSREATIEIGFSWRAYTAGLIDGEGCFRVSKTMEKRQGYPHKAFPHYSVRLTVANTDHDVLSKMRGLFGGTTYTAKMTSKNRKPVCFWIISGTALRRLLSGVGPYLIIKEKQAAVCERMLMTFRRKGRTPLTAQEIAERETLIRLMGCLNA